VSSDTEQRWYADWRVWLAMVLVVLIAAAQWLVGLPFRIVDRIWSFFF
jgi:hypothetical protein